MNVRSVLRLLLSLMLLTYGLVLTACKTGGTHPDPAVRKHAMEQTVKELREKDEASQR